MAETLGAMGGSDAWLFKIDSSGNLQWQRSIGGSGGEGVEIVEIFETKLHETSTGYMISMQTSSTDFDVSSNPGGVKNWVVKTDFSGNIVWSSLLDRPNYDIASIEPTSDGGALLYRGFTGQDLLDNRGGYDFGLVKISQTGSIQWEKSLGGSGEENLIQVIEMSDGTYTMFGSSRSNDGDIANAFGGSDIWVLNFDPSKRNDVRQSEIAINLQDLEMDTSTLSFSSLAIEVSNKTINKVSLQGISKLKAVSTNDKSLRLQIGANLGQSITVGIEDMRPEALGFSNGMPRVNPIEMAGVSLTLTDQAIMKLSSQRSTLGAYLNRLEHVIKNNDNSAENLQAAESRITDLDMAKGMAEFTKLNILDQAVTAMIAQANQIPQGVLQLLK